MSKNSPKKVKMRKDNILILNWNTILFQSYGFISYMKELNVDIKSLQDMSDIDLKLLLLQYIHRSPTQLFDRSLTEKNYYDIIKSKYTDISNLSPATHLTPIMKIVRGQTFVGDIHIASISECEIPEILDENIHHVFFDIFDIKQIEDYINENDITSIFTHDVRIANDLIYNLQIDLQGFIFFVSKLGYNFRMNGEAIETLYPNILDIKESLGFEFAYIDLYELVAEDLKNNIL